MEEINKDKLVVGKMFDEISPTYDKLNHLMSGWQDIKWRRKAIHVLSKLNDTYEFILDLAAGSGDLTEQLLKLSPRYLFSVDLSLEMLKINKFKVNDNKNILLKSDALNLPFQNNFLNLVGISFGVRNFEKLENTIIEINRVLKNGGLFLTIEMFKNLKKSFFLRCFSFYFSKIVPKLGKILSKNQYAYSYLFQSVDSFLSIEEYSNLLMKNGFEITYIKNNFLGVVNTIIARKIQR